MTTLKHFTVTTVSAQLPSRLHCILSMVRC